MRDRDHVVRTARKHVRQAQMIAEVGADDMSRMHYNTAERLYKEAGLDPDWFGDEWVSRTDLSRCIPGHE